MLSLFFVYTSQTFTMHEQPLAPKTAQQMEQPLQATVDTKNKNNDTKVESEANTPDTQVKKIALYFDYPGAVNACHSPNHMHSPRGATSPYSNNFFQIP